jgi:hypothetical protein
MIFIATTLLYATFGIYIFFYVNVSNVGIIYYPLLSAFSLVMLGLLPVIKIYISKLLLAYTVVVIGCYTVYTSES